MLHWTTAVKPGVQATVNTIIENKHSGSNCLRVAITGSGKDSLVRLTSDAYAWDTSRIYMLRFWAISNHRAGELDVRIGEAGRA